jgi:uncharacterized protein (DUF58 family)
MTTTNQKRSGDQCVSVSLSELLQLSISAKQLSLSALRPKSTLSGQRVSRLLARGMEFAESRRYQSGDDIRNMDWRVTARTGKAHTKLFAVEKERQVLLAVDLRSPMFFATKGVFKSVQAALMTGFIGWKAVQAGDRLGGMIFDNESLFECRPALGKKGLFPLLHEMAERTHSFPQKSVPVSTQTDSSIDRAIAGIRKMATPGSLVFVVSDFRQLSSDSCDALLQISRHCDLHLCFIYDPFEAALPKNGHYPVTSEGRELQLNTHDKAGLMRYHQQYLERRNKVANLSQHRHISFMECSTDEDCFFVLRKCFN